MRYAPRALLAGGLGFALSFLVACGGGAGLLSGNQASSLNSQLDQISSAIDSHQCGTAVGAAASLSNAVANLPPSINPRLSTNLQQGATVIAQLAGRDCRNQATTTNPTTSTATTTTTNSSSTSSTQSSTTSPSTSTSTPATTASGSGTSTSSSSGGAGLGGGSGAGTGGAGTPSAHKP